MSLPNWSVGNLTAPVVQALLNAGLFYLMVPAALGGLEVDARTYLEVVEAISAADGSTGWCVMIGAELNGMVGVHLVVRKNWISMPCKGFLPFSHIAAWLTPPWTSALEVATISL